MLSYLHSLWPCICVKQAQSIQVYAEAAGQGILENIAHDNFKIIDWFIFFLNHSSEIPVFKC